MAFDRINLRQYSSKTLLLVGIVALILFSASYFVEIRIIVETPNYGDVTGAVQALWRAVLGITTIGSFVIGIYNLTTDSNDSSGPATGFEIKGTRHNIEFHLHLPERREKTRDRSKTVDDESDDNGTSTDRNEDSESEVDDDNPTDTT